jgi:16S rRNA (cytosine1402-N4)-methyltransferase
MSNQPPLSTGTSDDSSAGYHVPVLLNEAVEALQIKPDGVYVDATFGGGGHSREILKHLNENGKLIVFDQDADAKVNVPDDKRVLFVPQNFRHLQRFLRLHKILQVDGILADLGVSSHQFDEATRGFSFRFEAALDMRMDQRQTFTAATILKTYTELQLHKMFEQYGEVSNSKTLAKTIVEQRSLMAITTIQELKRAVQPVVMGNPQKYFAQFFQALRIAVNDELGALKEMLQQIPALLKPGARVAIITFHSLEDRIVKNFFKTGTMDEPLEDDLFGRKPVNPLLIITKKPVLPSAAECKINSRVRSAKMRVAEKKA